MLYNYDCYQTYLRDELSQRLTQKSQYSLRAFARDLCVSPATLSQVISGRRKLSKAKASELSGHLNFSDEMRDYFLLLVEHKSCKDLKLKVSLEEKILNKTKASLVKTKMSLDSFKLISEWYHYPILELSEIEGFYFSESTVAKKLNIKKIQASSAINRLISLGLLEKVGEGEYKQKYSEINVSSEKSNLALQAYHKQLFEKSIESLETQSPSERIIGSETVALSEDDLKDLKSLVDNFLDSVANKKNKPNKKTAVYSAIVNIFRITSNKEN